MGSATARRRKSWHAPQAFAAMVGRRKMGPPPALRNTLRHLRAASLSPIRRSLPPHQCLRPLLTHTADLLPWPTHLTANLIPLPIPRHGQPNPRRCHGQVSIARSQSPTPPVTDPTQWHGLLQTRLRRQRLSLFRLPHRNRNQRARGKRRSWGRLGLGTTGRGQQTDFPDRRRRTDGAFVGEERDGRLGLLHWR